MRNQIKKIRWKLIKAPLALANLLWDKSGELIKPKKERISLGKKIRKATAKEMRKRQTGEGIERNI